MNCILILLLNLVILDAGCTFFRQTAVVSAVARRCVCSSCQGIRLAPDFLAGICASKDVQLRNANLIVIEQLKKTEGRVRVLGSGIHLVQGPPM